MFILFLGTGTLGRRRVRNFSPANTSRLHLAPHNQYSGHYIQCFQQRSYSMISFFCLSAIQFVILQWKCDFLGCCLRQTSYSLSTFKHLVCYFNSIGPFLQKKDTYFIERFRDFLRTIFRIFFYQLSTLFHLF